MPASSGPSAGAVAARGGADQSTASTASGRGGAGAASGVREKTNGATATGASPSTPPARLKVPRARLCSLAANSSGVWIGASGTPRARASAKTSARVRWRDRLGGDQADRVVIRHPVERHLPLRRREGVGAIEESDQGAPVAAAGGQDAHVAVGDGQDEIVAVGGARRRRRQEGVEPVVVGERDRPGREAADGGFLRRHLDRLPAAVPGAIEERDQRAGDAEHRRTVVRAEARDRAGRSIRKSGVEQRAGSGEGDDGLGVPLRARAREAEVGQRDLDQCGMALAHGLGGEVEHLAAIRAVVLEQDVGGVAQGAKARRVGGGVQIEGERALVEVAIDEGERPLGSGDAAHERRLLAAGVAAGRLDLDHVGAEVGEQPPRQRAAQVGEIDDAQVRERPGHASPLATAVAAGKKELPREVAKGICLAPSRPRVESLVGHSPSAGPAARQHRPDIVRCRGVRLQGR